MSSRSGSVCSFLYSVRTASTAVARLLQSSTAAVRLTCVCVRAWCSNFVGFVPEFHKIIVEHPWSMRWAEQVARMGEKRNAYRILAVWLEEEEGVGVDTKLILKRI